MLPSSRLYLWSAPYTPLSACIALLLPPATERRLLSDWTQRKPQANSTGSSRIPTWASHFILTIRWHLSCHTCRSLTRSLSSLHRGLSIQAKMDNLPAEVQAQMKAMQEEIIRLQNSDRERQAALEEQTARAVAAEARQAAAEGARLDAEERYNRLRMEQPVAAPVAARGEAISDDPLEARLAQQRRSILDEQSRRFAELEVQWQARRQLDLEALARRADDDMAAVSNQLNELRQGREEDHRLYLCDDDDRYTAFLRLTRRVKAIETAMQGASTTAQAPPARSAHPRQQQQSGAEASTSRGAAESVRMVPGLTNENERGDSARHRQWLQRKAPPSVIAAQTGAGSSRSRSEASGARGGTVDAGVVPGDGRSRSEARSIAQTGREGGGESSIDAGGAAERQDGASGSTAKGQKRPRAGSDNDGDGDDEDGDGDAQAPRPPRRRQTTERYGLSSDG